MSVDPAVLDILARREGANFPSHWLEKIHHESEMRRVRNLDINAWVEEQLQERSG